MICRIEADIKTLKESNEKWKEEKIRIETELKANTEAIEKINNYPKLLASHQENEILRLQKSFTKMLEQKNQTTLEKFLTYIGFLPSINAKLFVENIFSELSLLVKANDLSPKILTDEVIPKLKTLESNILLEGKKKSLLPDQLNPELALINQAMEQLKKLVNNITADYEVVIDTALEVQAQLEQLDKEAGTYRDEIAKIETQITQDQQKIERFEQFKQIMSKEINLPEQDKNYFQVVNEAKEAAVDTANKIVDKVVDKASKVITNVGNFFWRSDKTSSEPPSSPVVKTSENGEKVKKMKKSPNF